MVRNACSWREPEFPRPHTLTFEADKRPQVAADLRELATELQALAGQLDPPATT